jgi:hypothetical protein
LDDHSFPAAPFLLWIPEDLFQKKASQDRDKVNHGNDCAAKAHLVNPAIAEISLLPVGRFDEMLKTYEQAHSSRDAVMHKPGLPDFDGC